MIRERVQAGIDRARSAGKRLGRPRIDAGRADAICASLASCGVTRGKRLVVLIGQRKALAIAVKRKEAGRQWSKLAEWLR